MDNRISTSIAPDLVVIKVRVSSHFLPAGEECVGQGATLPVKRVPIVVKQAVKRHSDVPSSRRPHPVARQAVEVQGGRVAPRFEGMSQDAVHQAVWQAG